MNITPASSVGIIGGAGNTGAQFAGLFEAQGFTVDVTGEETCDRNAELMEHCDIIVFSVPLSQAADIIREEMQHAKRADQLLLDFSSLKQEPMRALLQGAGEIIGLHPLFGPWTAVDGETVIMCPERAPQETVDSLAGVLHAMGLKTKTMTSLEHDKLMVLLQVLPHVKNFLVARTLQKMDADIDEMLAMSTPPYELELNVVGRFLDDSADLYGSIIINNPDTLHVLHTLRGCIDECIEVVEQRNLSAFSKLYDGLKQYFGSLTKTGRERSEACIHTLASSSS